MSKCTEVWPRDSGAPRRLIPKGLCHPCAGLFIVIAVSRDLWKWSLFCLKSSQSVMFKGLE